MILYKLKSEKGTFAEWSKQLGNFQEGKNGKLFICEPSDYLINNLEKSTGIKWAVVEVGERDEAEYPKQR